MIFSIKNIGARAHFCTLIGKEFYEKLLFYRNSKFGARNGFVFISKLKANFYSYLKSWIFKNLPNFKKFYKIRFSSYEQTTRWTTRSLQRLNWYKMARKHFRALCCQFLISYRFEKQILIVFSIRYKTFCQCAREGAHAP